MKKPAIIDQEIEFTVYSHAMITPPMEVEDYNSDDPAELIYASANELPKKREKDKYPEDYLDRKAWAFGRYEFDKPWALDDKEEE